MRRTTKAAKHNDARFPVRLKFKVPDTGLGADTDKAEGWLLENVGAGSFAVHNAPTIGGDAMAVYLLNLDDAMRFMAAHPKLELAGGTPFERKDTGRDEGYPDKQRAIDDFVRHSWGYVCVVHDVMHGPNVSDEGFIRKTYVSPVYLLLGFATELTLKAAYLAHGGVYDNLNTKIGHKLKTGHAKALALGFKPQDPEGMSWLVSLLHDCHADFWMRYDTMPDGEIPFPIAGRSVDILKHELLQLHSEYSTLPLPTSPQPR